MLVYGERTQTIEPRQALARIAATLPLLAAGPRGLARHAALAEALIELGMIIQGVADAAFEQIAQDDDTPLTRAGMSAMASLAALLVASWRASFTDPLAFDPEPLQALMRLPLPDSTPVKWPEGYAYYAVYPEAYIEAARALETPATVVGLRSIGTSLAPAVAAALGAKPAFTLRPAGHPFDRQLRISGKLKAVILRDPLSDFVIVDEGPGLSGSSFGATAAWLEENGVPSGRINFLPSHRGPPGAMASPANRQRWSYTRRPVVEFDDLALSPARRLQSWVSDLTGPAVAPLTDLSGGQWRKPDRLEVPAYPTQERRKFLLKSETGTWLLKFAGLGPGARRKLERAQILAHANFTVAPAGLRHGFLVEPWLEVTVPLDSTFPRATLLATLGGYLAFRARNFPADPQDGATQRDLITMVEANTAEAFGPEAAREILLTLPRQPVPLNPIHTDSRLHAWEWLVTSDGRLRKGDALDHDNAHDLIGCQDLAWDVAGAEIELDLSGDESEALRRGLAEAGHPIHPGTLDLMRAAYPAFQLGLWTHALASAPDESPRIHPLLARYRARLEGRLNR